MRDPRTTPFNGRVAHTSLKGQVEAERFVEGSALSVIWSVTALRSSPEGGRERELVFGETFVRLDDGPGHAFGFAERDGYVGVVEAHMLAVMPPATHIVKAAATHALAEPNVKTQGEHFPLSFGSRVAAIGQTGDWTEIATPTGVRRYIPTCHLRAKDEPETDPVVVARKFLNVPYVWGGNSNFGIDCSGLIQRARHACGWTCPGDSDLQAAMSGVHLDADAPLQAGDLIFWKGHVAMATGPDAIIHANAHHMAVVEEPIAPAIERIAATDTGSVTQRLRPSVN